eukprot:9253-Heterococcus_DN1.PRE.2
MLCRITTTVRPRDIKAQDRRYVHKASGHHYPLTAKFESRHSKLQHSIRLPLQLPPQQHDIYLQLPPLATTTTVKTTYRMKRANVTENTCIKMHQSSL